MIKYQGGFREQTRTISVPYLYARELVMSIEREKEEKARLLPIAEIW